MTVQSSRHSSPFRSVGSPPRPSGMLWQALNGVLVMPLVLLAACLNPHQARELADAESVG